MQKLRSLNTFFTKLACWGLLIFLMQLVLSPSLDKGQKVVHVIFENQISSIIQAHETLMGKQRVKVAGHKWPTGQLTKDEHLFHPIIVKAAARHEIDPALVKAIIMAESGYNPNAISKKGAKGLMQLMPGTARALGVEDIFNPENNIDGGVRYFKQLVVRLNGDVKLALAAYNSGFRKVKKFRGVPPFKATKYYIKKVFRYYRHYREHTGSEMNQA